ncbi:hypothetical protein R3P38DRAFT_2933240 [Favolaschia claudopus]|uniref:GATA-type domain-containing protein n=1 Tax=Favolaschia claudopus TaxID=2862362 RepID=A0AAW0BUA6_9AGAR
MFSSPLAPSSPASFLNPLSGFTNNIGGISLAPAGGALVPDTDQASISEFHFDEYPEFSSHSFDTNYAPDSAPSGPTTDEVTCVPGFLVMDICLTCYTSSAPVDSDPFSSSNNSLLQKYSLPDRSIPTETLDTLFTCSNERWNTSYPRMLPTALVSIDEVKTNARHPIDNDPGFSTSVGSFMLTNHPIDTLTSDSIDTRHTQFCDRLLRAMNEESIDPRIVLNFIRRKATVGVSSRRYRAINRDTRVCSECGTQKTTQWRRHPNTGAVVCNPCGQRASRARMLA